MTQPSNEDFRIEAKEWHSYPLDDDVGPFEVMASSMVRDLTKPLEAFERELLGEISGWGKEILLGVFPEYCWRTTHPPQVFECIERLRAHVPSHLTLVLGTLEFTLNGRYTNNAIIIHDRWNWYVPKLHVLDREINQKLVSGLPSDPRVIRLPRFRLGVMVCADLWDMSLAERLVKQEGAHVLAVPSWFAVAPGRATEARQKCHALMLTQCQRLHVTVAVADHCHHFATSEVANATGVFSRDRLPPADFCFSASQVIKNHANVCDPPKDTEARESWIRRGLPW